MPGSELGLPEVGLGLLPACGGVVRVVRRLGPLTTPLFDTYRTTLREGRPR